MGNMNPKVDAYIRDAEQWQEETAKLRAICIDSDLVEAFKWRKPCYTFEGSNIAIIQGFKEYCALMFFKGALLEDTSEILVAPGKNSQAGRQVRFADVREILETEATLNAYIQEAIEVEKAGLQVEYRDTSDYEVPKEFEIKLDKDPALKAAFEALTPGRQRAYILHFSSAKRSATRTSRVEKCIPMILDGRGLNDR